MKNQNKNNNGQIQVEIANRAYHFWEAAGRPAGRDAEFWLQAESELLAANKPVSVSAKPSAGPARSAAPISTPVKPAQPSVVTNAPQSPQTGKPVTQTRRA